jgi:hypothetical protein
MFSNQEGFWDCYNRGWSSIPLNSRSKTPLLRHLKDDAGNTVGTAEEDTAGWLPYTKARADERTITRWLDKWPTANPGLVTGQISGLVVLDLDGPVAHRWIIDHFGYQALTVATLTGGGELHSHCYYQYPYDLHPGGWQVCAGTDRLYLPGWVGGDGTPTPKGVDVRADHGYVVYPGAIHRSGRICHFVAAAGLDPDHQEIMPLPMWLRDMFRTRLKRQMREEKEYEELHDRGMQLRRGDDCPPRSAAQRKRLDAYAAKALENASRDLANTPCGSRHDALYKTAASLSRFVEAGSLQESAVVSTLEEAARANGLLKEDGARSVRTTIKDGLQRGRNNPIKLPSERQNEIGG